MHFDRAINFLIIQSNDFQRNFASNILGQMSDHNVIIVENGEQALARLKDFGYIDFAVISMKLIDMDGLEFARRAAQSGLLGGLIINDDISPEMRKILIKITDLLGLSFFHDFQMPISQLIINEIIFKNKNALTRSYLPKNASFDHHYVISDNEVADALYNDEFLSFYQPKFNMITNEVTSVEVLARWQHPTKGILPPSVFMPILKRLKLTGVLLTSQLEAGLSLQKIALQRGFRLNIAFNLEAAQLDEVSLATDIKRLLIARSASGSGLTFELTESDAFEGTVNCLENLVRFQMMGCRLSLDDFGIGFSSLQRLCELPVTEIKVDYELTRHVVHQSRYQLAIRNILSLADELQISVVAEGIETNEQIKVLTDLGCKYGQGYICAEPMREMMLINWLESDFYAQNMSKINGI